MMHGCHNTKHVATHKLQARAIAARIDAFQAATVVNDGAHADLLDEMKARLIGWNDATSDMFQWKWVRWNFPDPVSPYQ
jgi:hypothetical protein